ncbi:hypothetical protein TRFO_16913 [Tritrichomonas foetus]|uniref:Uncharacterized protein n=1 Tax=Tritrichomonas foetus TaxID=1144522 RepID=A0A1J4KPZ1_9EUKA|nr:hypothetical protein TRFO_16913 [Tritrichomonas foetus]|eukprot:OHT12968.1 hypothetical protein TRFO_16913 [Tritrichomonas foetus]
MDVFSVHIVGCTELFSDCPMKNVGVRVSLASISTGQLLKKSEKSQKVLSQYEKCSFIPQFCTCGIDCNSLDSFSAIWDETFIINESSSVLLNPDHVMVFEIIDYTIHPGRHFFNSIAFGILKLKSSDGCSRNTNKQLKVQLYAYPSKFNASVIGSTLPVLSLMESKKAVESVLTVEVDEIFSSEIEQVKDRPENVYQKEVSIRSLDELLDSDAGLSNFNSSDMTNYSVKRVCQIPRYLNVQIPAGEHGALCLRFNRAGTILAAAVQINNDYCLNFYNTSSFSLISTYPAHIDLIYEIAFSYSDEKILSVSSDGNCRIWHGDGTPQPIATLSTTNYLYTAKFHPLDENIVATAGYDGIIRIWDVSTEKVIHTLSEHKTRINSLVFSPNGKQMFAGDASGCISVWDVNLQSDQPFTFQKLVAEGEIKNTNITNLSMGRSNLSLLVTTQDNTVRNFETKVMVPSQRYVGALCSKYMMEASFSPDAKYVFAGSENGSVCVWNVKENEIVSVIEWTHKFKSPVTTIAWNHRFDMCAFSSFGDGEPILVYKDSKYVRAPRRRPIPKKTEDELKEEQEEQKENQSQNQNEKENENENDQSQQSQSKTGTKTGTNTNATSRSVSKPDSGSRPGTRPGSRPGMRPGLNRGIRSPAASGNRSPSQSISNATKQKVSENRSQSQSSDESASDESAPSDDADQF